MIAVIPILLFIFVMTIAISAILNGWVLSILWGWFIVPHFGLPALSIPVAIGIALVVSMLAPYVHNKYDEDNDKLAALSAVFIRPFIALLIGWVTLQFV